MESGSKPTNELNEQSFLNQSEMYVESIYEAVLSGHQLNERIFNYLDVIQSQLIAIKRNIESHPDEYSPPEELRKDRIIGRILAIRDLSNYSPAAG
jgi:hypothetical protein